MIEQEMVDAVFSLLSKIWTESSAVRRTKIFRTIQRNVELWVDKSMKVWIYEIPVYVKFSSIFPNKAEYSAWATEIALKVMRYVWVNPSVMFKCFDKDYSDEGVLVENIREIVERVPLDIGTAMSAAVAGGIVAKLDLESDVSDVESEHPQEVAYTNNNSDKIRVPSINPIYRRPKV